MNLGSILASERCGIFIINLNRRQDRWTQISTHLNELQCTNYRRVEAVDGLLESKELAKRVALISGETPSQEPTRRQQGVVGCIKSHLKALQYASQMDKALILEDDCFFIDDASHILHQTLNELPQDWQYLMLGAIYGTAPGYLANKPHVMRVHNATAAHAYMVNRDSCQLLIQKIEALLSSRVIQPIDEWFTCFQLQENWYATHPLIAGQRSGEYSDIDGAVRVHTVSCFKLGVEINLKIWLWMKIRPSVLDLAKRISNLWRWVFR